MVCGDGLLERFYCIYLYLCAYIYMCIRIYNMKLNFVEPHFQHKIIREYAEWSGGLFFPIKSNDEHSYD